MGASDLDLEAIWAASPDGPPPDVPETLWHMVRSARPHAGIFRGPAGDLVVVCALDAAVIGRYGRGEISVQRGADDQAGLPRIMLSFHPAPPAREGEPALQSFGIRFELEDPGQQVLWRELINQGRAVVSFIDISEGVLAARRELDLTQVSTPLTRVLELAERQTQPDPLPQPPV